MRKIMALALAIVVLPFTAGAQDVRGQWSVLASNRTDYMAVVLIDAEGRFTWDSPNDGGRQVQFFGAVIAHDATEFHAIITDRVTALKVDCGVAARELLQCRSTSNAGKEGTLFFMRRVGPGPLSLKGAR